MYKNSMKIHNGVIILIRGSLLVELNFDLKVMGSKWRHVPIKTEGGIAGMFAELGFATFEADGKLKLTSIVQLKIKMEVDQDKVTISGGGLCWWYTVRQICKSEVKDSITLFGKKGVSVKPSNSNLMSKFTMANSHL